MRQRFESDEVIAELGGSSFMTKRGIVVEGDYRIGEKVLLVFDHASKRYLPVYRRKKDKSLKAEKVPFASGSISPKCKCKIILDQTSEVEPGDVSVAAADVTFDGCSINLGDYQINWSLIPDTGVDAHIVQAMPYLLQWQADSVSGDCGYVTIRAEFNGGGAECVKEVRVKVMGCTCEASLQVSPGTKVGSGDEVTVNLNLQYTGCSTEILNKQTVNWDIAIWTCNGTCSFEIIEQDDEHIVFIPTVEDGDGGYAVFTVCAHIEGPEDCSPFCEACEDIYVGCWCDVLVNSPSPIAPGYVYEATVKGWYHDCSEAEKSMAPVQHWFHDCETSGPYCDVQVLSIEEISADPPEYKVRFAVNKDAGSGFVYLSAQIGSQPDDVPYCRYDQLITIDCCEKLEEDRIVIIYTEPEDVETISPEDEVDLWVEPGTDGGCFPFAWSLDGPGTLEVSEDTTGATYTAPKEDEYDTCVGAKVRIKVTDACGTEDEMEMSVNAIKTNQIAYRKVRVINNHWAGSWCNNCPNFTNMYHFHSLLCWTWGFDNYNCAGDYVSWSWGNNCNFCQSHSEFHISDGCEAMGTEGRDCSLYASDPNETYPCCGLRSQTTCRGAYWSSICPGGPTPAVLQCAYCGLVLDCRTEWLKTHKCCPGALPD